MYDDHRVELFSDLMALRQFYSDSSRLSAYALEAETAEGAEVPWNHARAERFSLTGATLMCVEGDDQRALRVWKLLRETNHAHSLSRLGHDGMPAIRRAATCAMYDLATTPVEPVMGPVEEPSWSKTMRLRSSLAAARY